MTILLQEKGVVSCSEMTEMEERKMKLDNVMESNKKLAKRVLSHKEKKVSRSEQPGRPFCAE